MSRKNSNIIPGAGPFYFEGNKIDEIALFDGDVLMAVSGGPSAPLEPVLLRTRTPRRDTICWKRGETTASPTEIMEFNGITPEFMIERTETLMM